jgi:hypothetical protein
MIGERWEAKPNKNSHRSLTHTNNNIIINHPTTQYDKTQTLADGVYLTYEIASVVYLLYHCGWWVMRMGMCSD